MYPPALRQDKADDAAVDAAVDVVRIKINDQADSAQMVINRSVAEEEVVRVEVGQIEHTKPTTEENLLAESAAKCSMREGGLLVESATNSSKKVASTAPAKSTKLATKKGAIAKTSTITSPVGLAAPPKANKDEASASAATTGTATASTAGHRPSARRHQAGKTESTEGRAHEDELVFTFQGEGKMGITWNSVVVKAVKGQALELDMRQGDTLVMIDGRHVPGGTPQDSLRALLQQAGRPCTLRMVRRVEKERKKAKNKKLKQCKRFLPLALAFC